MVASSYSKNFELYCERVGMFTIVTQDKDKATKVGSHIKQIIRGNYSNPSAHGARIIATILNSESLKNEWLKELTAMRERIQQMRKELADGLQTRQKKIDFSYINRQQGIFSYSGLREEQVKKLRNDYGIFMPTDGRINVAGLNKHNLPYVIDAITAVL